MFQESCSIANFLQNTNQTHGNGDGDGDGATLLIVAFSDHMQYFSMEIGGDDGGSCALFTKRPHQR